MTETDGATPIDHVILDRDGVLDIEPPSGWVTSWSAWEWERGALDGLRTLAAAGVRVSIATNQSGIGRGVVAPEDVAAVHGALEAALRDLGVDLVGIFVCPHAPDDGCGCRKPAPGLVLDAVARSGIPAERTALVGDSERDLAAAVAAGVRPVLVQTGKGARTERSVTLEAAVLPTLAEAAVLLVGGAPPSRGAPR